MKAFGRRAWPVTLVVTTLVYGALLHAATLGMPGFPPLDGLRLAGWAGVGRNVEDLAEAVELETGVEPLIVGVDRYRTASMLAFYRLRAQRNSDEEINAVDTTTSAQMIGEEGLMYGWWTPPEPEHGRPMVVVGSTEKSVTRDRVEDRFASMGPLRVFEAPTPNGGTRRLYARVGTGYRPPETTLADAAVPADPVF